MGVLPSMISLLTYAKLIAKNYSNFGSIIWAEENRVLVFKGARIVMDNLRAMVENAIHEAEDLLWLTLMSILRETDRFELNINKLTDDMSSRECGSSFVDHQENGLTLEYARVTVTRLLGSDNGKKMRRDGKWHPTLTKEYLRQVDKFRKLLLFCVHVTGGQLARGTEILSLRFKNGCVRPRNVFLLDGYVMTSKFYNKTDAEGDSPKIIPRFLPWRVGQLLSLYLVYIQPLAALIGDELGNESFQRQDLGQEFGTLGYRHIAVGIGRKFVNKHFAKDCCYTDEKDDVEEPEIATEDPLEMLAGRGTATGATRYAVRSDLVRHLMQDNVDTFRPLSQSWHSFPGLDSRKGRPATEPEAPRARNGVNSGEEDEVLLDRRADHADHHSHDPSLANTYYGAAVTARASLTSLQRKEHHVLKDGPENRKEFASL
ncbi:hypothetical protein E4U52_006542 [Claviceps spartinae]|nr:hypothetical protein E4U52_006542 [Claviceps spartinae]